MDNLATIGYFTNSLAFLVLAIILKTSWQGRMQGAALVIAAVVNAIWSGVLCYVVYYQYMHGSLVAVMELLRSGGWLAFLFILILCSERKVRGFDLIRAIAIATFVIITLEIVVFSVAGFAEIKLPHSISFEARIISLLVIAVIGLMLIEQLFRNSRQDKRWAIKFLCLGVGGLFIYDFYMYADALLLKSVNSEIWDARGYINMMVVPLIAVSAARNPQWSLDVFVSRKFVFHTTALMAAGVYLLAMAAGGYYIKLYGGSWGSVAQSAFLFGALIVLALLMFSGQIRGQFRVFLSKHFFNYRYDYREEWLKFINTLSDEKLDTHTREKVIQAVGDVVDSPGGMLWLLRESNIYRLMANLNMVATLQNMDEPTSKFTRFLQTKQWVVDLDEYRMQTDMYGDLELPQWINDIPQAWLIVPLLQQSQLFGFVIIARARAKMKINWENRDLLITTGRQATSYLALLDTTEALMDVRQFDAFNRLSAYVVHDLKNVCAQLSLVVKNSEKHKENPAFMDDVINTVDNSVKKMNHMLSQLRKNPTTVKSTSRVNIIELTEGVIVSRNIDKPTPKLSAEYKEVIIIAEPERLASVIEHLIQNAQDATDESGYVNVNISLTDKYALIGIEDNGCGMDAKFIRERLFRPFDTTKGNAGMGIGVYESREFIVSIGGRLDVVSELNKGTTFTIFLLLADHGRSEIQITNSNLAAN